MEELNIAAKRREEQQWCGRERAGWSLSRESELRVMARKGGGRGVEFWQDEKRVGLSPGKKG